MNQSDKVKDGDEQTLRKKWYMALTRYSLLLRNVRTSSKSPRSLQVWHLKTFVVLSLLRRIGRVAARSFKLGRRLFAKLQDVEDSIEIIAREMARHSKWSQ